MTQSEIQSKLNTLRQKWIGRVPKSTHPDYWKFRCDRCQALGLKSRLKEINSADTIQVAQMIFG